MAVDAFLKIDGVKGESKVKGMNDWIDILDVNFSIHNRASSHYGGGQGVGRADFGDISFVKRYDKASPTLMLFCANGKHIDKVEVILRKAGGDNALDFLKIEMKRCFVTSVVPSGLTSGDGMESLSLSFEEFDLTYQEQDEKGKKADAAKFFYDVKAQEKKN
jgi:type VI secretion system secreted protein Hcp